MNSEPDKKIDDYLEEVDGFMDFLKENLSPELYCFISEAKEKDDEEIEETDLESDDINDEDEDDEESFLNDT